MDDDDRIDQLERLAKLSEALRDEIAETLARHLEAIEAMEAQKARLDASIAETLALLRDVTASRPGFGRRSS